MNPASITTLIYCDAQTLEQRPDTDPAEAAKTPEQGAGCDRQQVPCRADSQGFGHALREQVPGKIKRDRLAWNVEEQEGRLLWPQTFLRKPARPAAAASRR